ncbi:MAG TPA: right-handed parallel beta-helix repeat-containing protein [Vicinamibacterales bacterium]
MRTFALGADSHPAFEARADGFHVYPGGSIQRALDAAATDARKRVVVHAGTYAPHAAGQALVWFNARHDGIRLEAAGDVILTAANPAVSDPRAHSHPAVVNHVVYFGDGLSRRTVFHGFRVTGANNFTTGSGERSPIESDEVRKTLFFYTDGGGIKVYARSFPTIENVEVFGNYTSPCGAGVSVEHLVAPRDSVLFRNCVFRDNRTQTTGSGFDLLHFSKATLENCLFAGNISNLGVDFVGILAGGEFHPEHGSGAMTVFAGAQAMVSRCTFTGNWNGVDDAGTDSTYVDSIFWQNTASGGIAPQRRYEIDIEDGSGVKGCFIHGEIDDLRGTVARDANTLAAPDPQFDERFVPHTLQYAAAGYRPSGG